MDKSYDEQIKELELKLKELRRRRQIHLDNKRKLTIGSYIHDLNFESVMQVTELHDYHFTATSVNGTRTHHYFYADTSHRKTFEILDKFNLHALLEKEKKGALS